MRRVFQRNIRPFLSNMHSNVSRGYPAYGGKQPGNENQLPISSYIGLFTGAAGVTILTASLLNGAVYVFKRLKEQEKDQGILESPSAKQSFGVMKAYETAMNQWK